MCDESSDWRIYSGLVGEGNSLAVLAADDVEEQVIDREEGQSDRHRDHAAGRVHRS
jgi:hypothetical protein